MLSLSLYLTIALLWKQIWKACIYHKMCQRLPLTMVALCITCHVLDHLVAAFFLDHSYEDFSEFCQIFPKRLLGITFFNSTHSFVCQCTYFWLAKSVLTSLLFNYSLFQSKMSEYLHSRTDSVVKSLEEA